MKKPLIVLTGPTAVGKTNLSIALAKEINGEIISADSMQVYKYMTIGSAKILPAQMNGIKHYLVDILDPSEEFHVELFQKLAKAAMDEIYAKGKIPILVGGTGFYIQAVLNDIDFTEHEADHTYREKLEKFANEHGGDALFEQLEKIDPESAAAIHKNNQKRVIRALEYFHQTGEKMSVHNEKEKQKKSPYNSVYFVLNDERDKLYERINRRIDEMLSDGLIQEVEFLKEQGYHKEMVSMQGLGYKEILSYLDGTYTLEEAVEILKRDTRHFAKRQLTWFRREPDVIWVDKNKFEYNQEEILDYLIKECKEREII